MWIYFVGIMTGVFLIVTGVLDPHDLGTMIGLVVCMAFFHEAQNEANFVLVPHVHPHAIGVLATGNCKWTGNIYVETRRTFADKGAAQLVVFSLRFCFATIIPITTRRC